MGTSKPVNLGETSGKGSGRRRQVCRHPNSIEVLARLVKKGESAGICSILELRRCLFAASNSCRRASATCRARKVQVVERDVVTGADPIEVTTYCFADCRFMPARQLLLRGDKPIRIGSRAMNLLHALVRRPGEAVDRNELFRAAWPNLFVEDSNLKVNIAALRRALKAAGVNASCIATVPGRGYRFVAPLTVLGPREDVLPASIRRIDGALPPTKSLIGRADVLADICEAMRQTRLLTIVGPAGVGKTSIAISAARQLADMAGQRVCFVDLAMIDKPEFVAPAVAHALGLESNVSDALAALTEALRACDLLLLLDNCEHVLSAASIVVDHLSHTAPRLLVIATSREPLRCRFEAVHRLAPLSCPPEEGLTSKADAMRYPAFELFVRRAAVEGYRLDEADVPAIAAMTRRVEGIALAIELAAARLPTCSATQLRALLDQSLTPLASVDHLTTSRHATLVATLEWSYRLLSGGDARLLRRMSIFGASVELDDIVATCADLTSAENIASSLESLCAKSLVDSKFVNGHRQYRLLDSMRKFATEKLCEASELSDGMIGYGRYLLVLFERAEKDWQWRTHEDWKLLYGRWGADIRRVIDWALKEDADLDLGVRLTASATTFWNEFSSLAESRYRVSLALDALEKLPKHDPVLRLKLYWAHAANLSFGKRLDGDLFRALRESRKLAVQVGNTEDFFRTTMGLASILGSFGCLDETQALMVELRNVMETARDYSAAPEVARQELMIGFYDGAIRESHAALKRLTLEHTATAKGVRVSRFHIDRFVLFRNFLAMTSWVSGNQIEALSLTRESIEAAQELGHGPTYCHALVLAAIPVALLCGAVDLAQDRLAVLAEILNLHQIDCWKPFLGLYQANIDAERGDVDAVARLFHSTRRLNEIGQRTQYPMRLAMLARAALHHDRLDIAGEVLAEADVYSKRYAAQWCDAEFLHLKGLLRQKEGKIDKAARLFQTAVESGLQSGALSFALRAATSRVKLATEIGDDCPTIPQLEHICRQLDEEDDTMDIREARALLVSARS